MDPATLTAPDIVKLLSAGGNVAVVIGIYYLVQIAKVLGRIDMALTALMTHANLEQDAQTGKVTPSKP